MGCSKLLTAILIKKCIDYKFFETERHILRSSSEFSKKTVKLRNLRQHTVQNVDGIKEMKLREITIFIVIFVLLVLGCSSMKGTITMMYENVDITKPKKVTETELQRLPEPVQKYLRVTNSVGKEKIKTVRLKQQGLFRAKRNQKWKALKAEQYFNVDSVEFYWKGKVSIVTATDRFIDGKGNMIVKLLGFIKLADARGPEVDQGEILRFLAEHVWFPSAFLNDYITWEAIDENTARATITNRGLSASATFHFNEKGEIIKVTAKRYMESNGKYSLEDWEILILEYKKFNDITIPSKCHVIWKLKDGDFCWYKFEIANIEYNRPFLY